MIIKLMTTVAENVFSEGIKYNAAQDSISWGKVINYTLDAIPLTGDAKQIFTIARKLYNYYDALSTLDEGKKSLEKAIANLEAAISEYKRQIHTASAAGLLNDYIVPLQKQLFSAEQKHRQMIGLLHEMIRVIRREQMRIMTLADNSKKGW